MGPVTLARDQVACPTVAPNEVRLDLGFATGAKKIFNCGDYGSEVESGLGEEAFDEGGAVLHRFRRAFISMTRFLPPPENSGSSSRAAARRAGPARSSSSVQQTDFSDLQRLEDDLEYRQIDARPASMHRPAR